MNLRRQLNVALIVSIVVCSCVLSGRRHETIDGPLSGHDADSPVTVVYDENGVPHVLADSDEDLFYGVGYVMAQDRFFFMDLVRKVGRGEASRLFGRMPHYGSYDLLNADRIFRSLDFGGRAAQGVSELEPEDLALLEAYCRGVNRYLDDAGKNLPEYRALGIRPDPWTPEDGLVCFDLYGLTMTAYSFFYEYYAARIASVVGPERARLFVPSYPDDAAYVNQDSLAAALDTPGVGAFHDVLLSFMPAIADFGSNNWVIDGAISASGKPVLANDPHVPTTLAPTFWYHVHINSENFDAAGLMFSGIPLMGAGTNGHVSWGITNARCDYIDVFREKVDPDRPGQYFYKGEWRDFETVTETLRIKGWPDKKHEYRRTVHGPVIEEAAMGIKYKWMGDEVLTLHLIDVDLRRFFSGYLEVSKSKDPASMKRAVKEMAMGPVAWNTVYATTDGDIGYIYSGHAPIRHDNQGVMPRPGDGSGDWQGLIPFDELPHVTNPSKHFIVTANNKIEPPGYPYYLSSGYVIPSRADRITELLAGRRNLTVRDMEDIQMDVKVKSAETMIPIIVEELDGAGDPKVERASDILRDWHAGGCMATLDSKGTGLYEVIIREIAKRTFPDELGKSLYSHLTTADMILHALFEIADDPDSEWWDDRTTPEVETRAEVFRAAALAANKYCEKQMGRDPADWEWGKLQRLTIRTTLGFLPWNRRYRAGTYPLAGTEESPKAAGGLFFGPLGFMNLAGPSSRIVVDMAEPRVIHFNSSTGNSENPDSPMFDSITRDWLDGEYRRLSMDEDEFREGAIGELVLEP